jgi:sugar/nucleoside kinase (ribokinase family)
MVYQEDEISFVRAQDCCVCFVDIVNSTRVTSSINNPEKIRKYYEIFLNTMAAISRNFEAKIIKNVGDCLILCYPRTSAAWSNGKETDYVNAFKVEPRIATGARDCWNAADIVGYLAGLDPRERLTFANAYASSYVRNICAEPPTMKETFEFLDSAGSIV